jgi:hypothetical protein
MRQKQEITDIWAKLFPQFSGSSGTLQGQVKEMMVHSILMGLVPAGAKVPPSRALAAALGLSRNTVYRLEKGEPGLALGQILRYVDAIAPGSTLLDLLAETDPALLTLEAREKTQRVRDMTAAELDELQF